MDKKKNELTPIPLRVIALALCDAAAVNLASFLALWLRFEFDLPALLKVGYLDSVISAAPYATVLTVLLFYVARLYGNMWLDAGADENIRVAAASAALGVLHYVVFAFMRLRIPRSFPFLEMILLAAMAIGIRAAYRGFHRLRKRRRRTEQRRTMLVGAGEAGSLILRDLRSSEQAQNKVVCIIDDDRSKHGMHLMGVRIVGGREDIPAAAETYGVQDIIIALPSVLPEQRRGILEYCQQVPHVRINIVPGLYQLASGEAKMQPMRDVELSDLLGRPEIHVELAEIGSYIAGKTVLVTGGGGSIGGELCRQISRHDPARLIIFDIYENNAYALQQELRAQYPALAPEVLIGSVRDAARLESVFSEYKPQLVFHAAAHKHVPLMEKSPAEAVKNNIFGTLNTAACAARHGTERFVLVSTDKAVRPANVMGASKRVCEMMIQAFSRVSDTNFVAVRFGNVLGSNGSVVPLFKAQILRGGPVTVTHRDITRYFMTVPESVSLILQAGAYATGGEIFVLDMGEQVRIDDLARNLIRLAGFQPDKEIRIEYTGLRPGEKLYEEILVDKNRMKRTPNHLIFVEERGYIDLEELQARLEPLRDGADSLSPRELRDVLHRLVPEYQEPESPEREPCTTSFSPQA